MSKGGAVSTRNTSLVALCIGLALSALGLLLVYLGGYGPCGPASPVAKVGAFLSVFHVELLCTTVPQLEDMLLHYRTVWLNLCVLLLIPAVNWSIVVFVLLKIGSMLRSYFRQSSTKHGTRGPKPGTLA